MNVYQFDTFGNELVLTKLSGNEIHDLMIGAFPVDNGLSLYPSGIRTMLKVSSDRNLTDVTLLTESGSPLYMNKTCTVAMNNYMTQVYKYNHSDPGQSLFISTADATIAYLKKNSEFKELPGRKKAAARKAKCVTTCPANQGNNLPLLSVFWVVVYLSSIVISCF